MHPQAFAQMDALLDKWTGDTARVLDVGSIDINGSYRPLATRRGWRYTGIDIALGPNVDLVAHDPYRYPFADATFDVVMSGSTMEHVQAIWLWVPELARLLKPTSGSVRLDGRPITSIPTREVSQHLALLPQSPVAPEGLLVRDLVGRGRHPHQRWFAQWSADDERVVEEVLRLTDTHDLRDRPLDQLSGGQRQRAWIAMTLAQDTDLVLLDEPTTYLDLAHQIDVLDLLVDLNREHGRTIVLVLHDLNQAARYSDHLVAMKGGEVVRAPSATP